MNIPIFKQCFIPDNICRQTITVNIFSDEFNEDGSPITTTYSNIKCNYQSSASSKFETDEKNIYLTGTCLIPGDPFNEFEDLSGGEVILNGTTRQIIKSTKYRNYDNTVNFTRLDLQ